MKGEAAAAGVRSKLAPSRPGPATKAGCCSHGGLKLFTLAQLALALLAAKGVRRIDAIFDAERTIKGLSAICVPNPRGRWCNWA